MNFVIPMVTKMSDQVILKCSALVKYSFDCA